ncbi:MAG: hypothetical protein IK093_20015 [Ruminiclostridium sp.]|nr:hypothetical protein [Ruminiclostridium sp.]
MDFKGFERSYWNYYIELEERIRETHRYIEYDESNFKTYSSYYLMLFQAVCSEIDVVGKEIAAYFNPLFDTEKNIKSINRWWFEVQDNLPEINREIVFANSFAIKPWNKYRVVRKQTEQFKNGTSTIITKYNLQVSTNEIKYSTPSWWNAYNKVKHTRLKSDNDGVHYKKANLLNLSTAFAALYLLEFDFMKKIGTEQDRLKCRKSELFGMGDLQDLYIHSASVRNGCATFI